MSKRCKWCHQVTDSEQELRDLRFELEEARTSMRSMHELLIEHQEFMKKRGIWEEYLNSLESQDSPDTIAIANVARAARERK